MWWPALPVSHEPLHHEGTNGYSHSALSTHRREEKRKEGRGGREGGRVREGGREEGE